MINMTEFREMSHTNFNSRKCNRCKKIKHLTQFPLYEGETVIRMTRCKECIIELKSTKIAISKGLRVLTPAETTRDDFKRPGIEAGWRSRIMSAIKRDFKRNRNIDKANITVTYMLNLFRDQNGICALTGRKMTLGLTRNGKIDKDALSIDRIDSSKGYIRGNVWYVTYQANMAKNIYSTEDLLSFCQDVVKTQEEGRIFLPKEERFYLDPKKVETLQTAP